MDLEALTARGAAHPLRTIDAVGGAAPPEGFEEYAALDELGAGLADWLRSLRGAPAPGRPIG